MSSVVIGRRGAIYARMWRAEGLYSVAPAVAELLALEERVGLHTPEVWNDFQFAFSPIAKSLWSSCTRLVAKGGG